MPPNSIAAGATARTWPATHHPSEDLFRLRKATLYADIIEAGGLAGAVDNFTEGQWAALAIVAQTKPPSLETCTVIRRLLRQRQEWRELVALRRSLFHASSIRWAQMNALTPAERRLDERATSRLGILGYGVRWSIAYPLGHDPATRRPLYHRKSIHGPKRDAQAYLDWYAGLMAAGQAPTETVSQSELQELANLQAKATQFKEKLLAKMENGAKVQPGPLSL